MYPARVVRLRAALVGSLAACGPVASQTTADPPATDSDEGTSTSTTATPATSSSSATTAGTTTPGTPGHWRGTYSSGFGFAYFEDCESGEMWLVQNLPAYEYCENAPLFIEFDGVLVVDDPDWPGTSIVVTELVAGPCIAGGCDDAVPWSACYEFDFACWQPLPDCDPLAQDCPEGQKCAPFDGGSGTWDDTRCVPVVPNPKQPGEPCSAPEGPQAGVDDCAEGSVCWKVDPDTLLGTCVAQCIGAYDMPACEDPQTQCLLSNSNALTLCLPSCDPLELDCPPGDTCLQAGSQSVFICVPDASGAEGQAFDPCMLVNSCDPGLFCANPALADECDPQRSGCCLSFCDLDMAQCPGAGQECLPWFQADVPAGLEDLGACGIPF